jgi:hypothetical protein
MLTITSFFPLSVPSSVCFAMQVPVSGDDKQRPPINGVQPESRERTKLTNQTKPTKKDVIVHGTDTVKERSKLSTVPEIILLLILKIICIMERI